MAKHEFRDAGNTFASSWYMCDVCGKLVDAINYALGAKDEECPGPRKEESSGEACKSNG